LEELEVLEKKHIKMVSELVRREGALVANK